LHNEQPIVGSNIFDLVYDLAKPVSAVRPVGSTEFLVQLKRANVPRTFIANKHRLEEIDFKPIFGPDVVAPLLVIDDLPPLPQTPAVPARPSLIRPAADRVRRRRQEERENPIWNAY
jgi:hypothetical protein